MIERRTRITSHRPPNTYDHDKGGSTPEPFGPDRGLFHAKLEHRVFGTRRAVDDDACVIGTKYRDIVESGIDF
jgi:hypothetical protein